MTFSPALEMLGHYCMKYTLTKCCDMWKSKRFQIAHDIQYANLLLEVCSICNDFFSCYEHIYSTLGGFFYHLFSVIYTSLFYAVRFAVTFERLTKTFQF